MSLKLTELLPTDTHQDIAAAVRLSEEIRSLVSSKTTLNVSKQDMNFRFSPIKTTFEIQGNASLIAFSIGIGAMFSPPAVMINSLILPERYVYT